MKLRNINSIIIFTMSSLFTYMLFRTKLKNPFWQCTYDFKCRQNNFSFCWFSWSRNREITFPLHCQFVFLFLPSRTTWVNFLYQSVMKTNIFEKFNYFGKTYWKTSITNILSIRNKCPWDCLKLIRKHVNSFRVLPKTMLAVKLSH